jgi:hypothetical protein
LNSSCWDGFAHGRPLGRSFRTRAFRGHVEDLGCDPVQNLHDQPCRQGERKHNNAQWVQESHGISFLSNPSNRRKLLPGFAPSNLRGSPQPAPTLSQSSRKATLIACAYSVAIRVWFWRWFAEVRHFNVRVSSVSSAFCVTSFASGCILKSSVFIRYR